MKTFFKPNISRNGRIVRAAMAVVMLLIAVLASNLHWGIRAALAGGGVFVAFEALRGWCALRACGIKTRV